MQVLAVGSQGEMLEHQAAARGLALPTHTYATLSKEQGRGQRSVMAVGPAPAELLDQVRLLVDLSRDLFSLWRFCSAALWWFGLKQISAVVHQVGFGEGVVVQIVCWLHWRLVRYFLLHRRTSSKTSCRSLPLHCR